MIAVDNLLKTYGEKRAVDIAHLEVGDGEVLGLVGNNGAGKTTLFRLILDLTRADRGTASIGGMVTSEGEAWKEDTGAYLDEGFLIDFLTPEEYFDFVGKVGGLSAVEIAERLGGFERLMGGEIMGQRKLIREFSAGNKQKIGIVSAMLTRPHTVILDEPFNFLDPSSQIVLKRMISEYASAEGATVVVSSHNLQHTVDISTRIALMEGGRVIRDLPNREGSASAELAQYFESEE